MSTLYAVAQTVGGMVLNTCNLSEDVVGYATLWGDNAGSYAPIQGLTVTEIRQLGDWMDLPHHLIHKTPIDGLQPLSDEDKLGFSYEALDRYIREDIGSDEFKAHINELYRKNKFKTDIVRIPGPNFDDLGNFVRYNNLVAEEEGM
jgi:NAD+ synthase